MVNPLYYIIDVFSNKLINEKMKEKFYLHQHIYIQILKVLEVIVKLYHILMIKIIVYLL